MRQTHTIIERDATPEEWRALMLQLQKLTEHDIAQIAELCGLEFTDNTSVTKDDYINILDEVYWDELAYAYHAVTGKELP